MMAPEVADILSSDVMTGDSPSPGFVTVEKILNEPTTLYDVLGSLGIPPCETGPVSDARTGTRIDPESRVNPGAEYVVASPERRPLADPRILADLHLGTLVRMLRMLGLDTAWETSGDEAVMAERAAGSGRVVLSRNRALLKRRGLLGAILIRSDHPDEQVAEVLRRFDLTAHVRMFGRCSRCNGTLAPVAKAAVADRIPPKTAGWLDEYYVCRDCDQLFWEGTHVTALRERLQTVLDSVERP
jgi:hypothetical protein